MDKRKKRLTKAQRDAFAEWMTRCFLEWEQSTGDRQTIEEFAKFLQEERPTVSHYLAGRRVPPDEFSIWKLSRRLGDGRVWGILGMRKPSAAKDKVFEELYSIEMQEKGH